MRNQFSTMLIIGLTFITTIAFAQNYMNQGPRMNNGGPQRLHQRSFQNNNNNSLLKADGMNQHQEQQNKEDLGKTRVYRQQQETQQEQQSSQSGSVL